jgi:formate hydrogenlyase subunit 4
MSLSLLIHLAVLVLAPPLLPGVINRVKAFFAGRSGPSVFQLYFDLAKLMRKEAVISPTTTWIFRLGPGLGVVTALAAGLLLPFGPQAAPFGFTGDFILFAYLLAVGRFLTTLAALDTGSSFEGMGVARELTFASLAEPALFLVFLVLARVSGSLRLGAMLQGPQGMQDFWPVALALAAAGLFVVLLAENCRVPVDDPNTHLELTMIHEVMVLDHSGPLLGLALYASSLKLFLFSVLLLHVLDPGGLDAGPMAWLVFAGGCLTVAAGVGLVESVLARLRMRHVSRLLVTACLLCGFAFLLVLR